MDTAFTSGASWSWPDDLKNESSQQDEHMPGAFAAEPEIKAEETESPPASQTQVEEDDGKNNGQASSKSQKQRHYGPRTCRICLETVLPTFEPGPEGLSGMLNPTPSVQYISSDPESGRLIRPCKCKGSQRYVHEGCLQAWRHADPAYGRRNYWECPTCKFRYRLARMGWSRWISSTLTQILLTVAILFLTIFILGFVADPILNLYVDPVTTLTSNPLSERHDDLPIFEDEDTTWLEHLLKGLASLGLLGFVKVLLAMSPFQWYNLRNSGLLSGGGRGGRTGRDRLQSISWYLIAIGVITFLWSVWKTVRSWSRRTLEKASERVVDVQGDDEDGIEDDPTEEPTSGIDPDAPKNQ